ncbi:MAG: hypothetical protein KDB27_34110, partial [Planctomycetales bacterium]|nr:hypothetical protein [Planctomycetales bacterium]
MFTRITPLHVTNNAIQYSTARQQQLNELQNQISSGIRIQKPSDAPADLIDLLATKELVHRSETNTNNISVARSKLNQGVTQMTSAKNAIMSALTYAIDGVQSTEPEALAEAVNGVINQLVDIANATDGVSPLFSGISDDIPFEISSVNDAGEVQSVTYVGHEQHSTIVIGQQAYVDVAYSGAYVFEPHDREATYFIGKTGAASGRGVDT